MILDFTWLFIPLVIIVSGCVSSSPMLRQDEIEDLELPRGTVFDWTQTMNHYFSTRKLDVRIVLDCSSPSFSGTIPEGRLACHEFDARSPRNTLCLSFTDAMNDVFHARKSSIVSGVHLRECPLDVVLEMFSVSFGCTIDKKSDTITARLFPSTLDVRKYPSKQINTSGMLCEMTSSQEGNDDNVIHQWQYLFFVYSIAQEDWKWRPNILYSEEDKSFYVVAEVAVHEQATSIMRDIFLNSEIHMSSDDHTQP